MHKNWKYVLDAAAISLGSIALLVAVMTSVKLGILMVVGSIFTGCIAHDKFNPTAMKCISVVLWVLMLPFIFVGSATSGTQIKWQMETSNAALPRPKKSEKADSEKESEKNQKTMVLLLRQLVENTGSTNEKLDDTNLKIDQYQLQLLRKLDGGKEASPKSDENKAVPPSPGLTIPDVTEEIPSTDPKPKTERTLPPFNRLPRQPKELEPQPEQAPPKGTLIEPAAPKAAQPDLRAKANRPTTETVVAVKCSCGKEHPVTGYSKRDKNGFVEPFYVPCLDKNGFAICEFESLVTK